LTPTKLNLTGSLPLILVLALVTAFDSMAIDMYLPAFTEMAGALNVETGAVQRSLAVFLIGLAVGQVFYGPLADRFGRRAPLIGGVILFTLASTLAAVAQDMTTFMVARVLQGLGGASGLVISRIIVADLYSPREGAKAFSLLMQVMMIAPIAAPPIGGVLLGVFGWRSIFWTLVIIGIIAIILLVRIVPESLAPEARRRSGIGSALRSYGSLLRQGPFTAYTLSGSFTIAGLFAYIGSSAAIFIEHYGLTPSVYSFVFASIALGQVIFGFVNVCLLNIWREREILPFGLALHALFLAVLSGIVLVGWTSIFLVGALFVLALVTLSLVFGNQTAMVMESAPDDSGSASSLFGVIQYVVAGLVGVALGIAHDGTLLPPVLVMLVCASGAFLAWWIGTALQRVPVTSVTE